MRFFGAVRRRLLPSEIKLEAVDLTQKLPLEIKPFKAVDLPQNYLPEVKTEQVAVTPIEMNLYGKVVTVDSPSSAIKPAANKAMLEAENFQQKS